MIKIKYPPHQPKIKTVDNKEFIFDTIRKQWIMLTPEEWVRQNFLQYLVMVKNYPASLIAVEKEIKLIDLIKRFDILVYDQNMSPWMIIECKEMNEVIDKKALDQVLRYNISLQVPYIILTNGTYCYGFVLEDGKFEEINELPAY